MSGFIFFFPILFIGLWFAIIFFISKLGWAKLASRFRFQEEFHGKYYGIISASINYANYNNALILRYNDAGIYLKPIFLFRMFHPAILIPWKEIKEVSDKQVLFLKFKELTIGNPAVIKMKIKPSLYREISDKIPLEYTTGYNNDL